MEYRVYFRLGGDAYYWDSEESSTNVILVKLGMEISHKCYLPIEIYEVRPVVLCTHHNPEFQEWKL